MIERIEGLKKKKTLDYRAIPPYHSGILLLLLLLRFEDALETFALKPSRGEEGNPTNPAVIDRPRAKDGVVGNGIAGNGVTGDELTGDGAEGDGVEGEGVVGDRIVGTGRELGLGGGGGGDEIVGAGSELGLGDRVAEDGVVGANELGSVTVTEG